MGWTYERTNEVAVVGQTSKQASKQQPGRHIERRANGRTDGRTDGRTKSAGRAAGRLRSNDPATSRRIPEDLYPELAQNGVARRGAARHGMARLVRRDSLPLVSTRFATNHVTCYTLFAIRRTSRPILPAFFFLFSLLPPSLSQSVSIFLSLLYLFFFLFHFYTCSGVSCGSTQSPVCI